MSELILFIKWQLNNCFFFYTYLPYVISNIFYSKILLLIFATKVTLLKFFSEWGLCNDPLFLKYWSTECLAVDSKSGGVLTSASSFFDIFLILWFQILFILILSIWARASGPRFRPDQTLNLTWKDLLVTLSLHMGYLLFFIFFFF